MNSLKNISIKKFVEHVVDNTIPSTPTEPKKENIILSKEEREANLLNKFKNAISISLEGLNIKNLIDLKENPDGSVIDEDAVSVTSSRYFSNMQRNRHNLKLPHIIGTSEFFRNEYLGVNNDDRRQSEANRRMTNLADGVEVNLNTELSNNAIVTSPKQSEREVAVVNNSPNIPSVPQTKPNIPNVPSVPQTKPNIPNVPSKPNIPSNIPNVPSVPINPKIPVAPQFNASNKNTIVPAPKRQPQQTIEEPVKESKPIDLKSSLEQRFRGQTVVTAPSTETQKQENKEINVQQKGTIKLDAFLRRNTTRQPNFYKIDEDEEEEEGPLFKRTDTAKVTNTKNNLFEDTSTADSKPIEQPKNISLPKPLEDNNTKTDGNKLESKFF